MGSRPSDKVPANCHKGNDESGRDRGAPCARPNGRAVIICAATRADPQVNRPADYRPVVAGSTHGALAWETVGPPLGPAGAGPLRRPQGLD